MYKLTIYAILQYITSLVVADHTLDGAGITDWKSDSKGSLEDRKHSNSSQPPGISRSISLCPFPASDALEVVTAGHTHTHTHTQRGTQTQTHTCTHIQAYKHSHTHKHKYTHTHTHTQSHV